MSNKKHYLTLAVLSKEKYEWKLIEVNYEHEFLSPRDWLSNYWEDYENYERIVLVDDIKMEMLENE